LDTKKQIENFIIIAESLIESVDSIKSPSYEDHYKKILYLSLMEMLCKAVFGNKYKRDHRTKVIDFINDFCTWEYAQHISLPQLAIFLKSETPTELIELKEKTLDLLSKWSTSKPIYLRSDPHINELKYLWPNAIKIHNKWISLNYFRHDNLLYTLRNSYVHENRSPGYSFHLFDDIEEPYYTSRMAIVKSVDDTKSEYRHEAFELNHPVGFFKNLLLNALPHMKQFLLDQLIDPYANFSVGSEWIKLME
jgi:hypothetical protein